MITIKLVDARRGLNQKCRELFSDRRIADQIYEYLCDGIEECECAEPERKTGKWIPVKNGRGGFECSECHEYAPSYQDGVEWLSKFCPGCGADMKEGAEQE